LHDHGAEMCAFGGATPANLLSFMTDFNADWEGVAAPTVFNTQAVNDILSAELAHFD